MYCFMSKRNENMDAVRKALAAAEELHVDPTGVPYGSVAGQMGIHGQRVTGVELGKARKANAAAKRAKGSSKVGVDGTKGSADEGLSGGAGASGSVVEGQNGGVGQRRTRLVESPGVSFVGFDPGGTTGVAVWDAWDRQWYVDNLDAGRGVRHRAHAVVYDGHSAEWNRAAKALGYGPFAKKATRDDWRIIQQIERGCVSWMVDCVRALGPNTVVVMEDFVLRMEENSGTSKREGLSPVRIMAAFEDRMYMEGLVDGDAWREWLGFGVAAEDGRGVHVGPGGVGTFKERLAASIKWAEHPEHGLLKRQQERVVRDRTQAGRGRPLAKQADGGIWWSGGGITYTRSMPSNKQQVGNEYLREKGLWVPSRTHGMDAVRHVVVAMRKMAFVVPKGGERIWPDRG